MNIPRKITILCNGSITGYGGSFTVIAENIMGKLEVQEELAYDEMLGVVARACCPTMSDGTPNRKIGRALFLEAPKPQE